MISFTPWNDLQKEWKLSERTSSDTIKSQLKGLEAGTS